jgi:hypothetical protein
MKRRAQEDEESGGGESDIEFDLSPLFIITMANGALNGPQYFTKNFGGCRLNELQRSRPDPIWINTKSRIWNDG